MSNITKLVDTYVIVITSDYKENSKWLDVLEQGGYVTNVLQTSSHQRRQILEPTINSQFANTQEEILRRFGRR